MTEITQRSCFGVAEIPLSQMLDVRLSIRDQLLGKLPIAPYARIVSKTNAWALPLIRRLAVDHGRMRSSLCLF